MKSWELMGKFLLVGVVVVAVAAGTDAYAGKPDCPHADLVCPMVWDPVICNDGEIYSNKCVAKQNCAKGCVPYDDGGPLPAGGDRAKCERPKFCPELWAPVICDDGKVYANECWAQKKCATGCVPYGDWLFPEGDGRGTCERPKVCPKLWAPVICDDGKVYPNACWAQKKCATGCVPYDDWLFSGGDRGNCEKPKFCPLIWAPVICDDGKVYANDCWAQKKCATGCVPYGDWFSLGGERGTCERPKVCPKLWAPVICDDGKVYPNACWAQKKCATGCVPYVE